jgi:hypothetical protein
VQLSQQQQYAGNRSVAAQQVNEIGAEEVRAVEVQDTKHVASDKVHFSQAPPHVHRVESQKPQNVAHLDHSNHRFSRLSSKESLPPPSPRRPGFTRLLSAGVEPITRLLSGGPFTRTG